MTGERVSFPGCPHCRIEKGEWHDKAFCTGRPGCVRIDDHPPHTTPLVPQQPATRDIQDLPDRHASEIRLAVLAERARHHTEIARLRDENERLTKELAKWSEKCGDCIEDMMAEIDRLHDDRAALARQVADAVREACTQRIISWWVLPEAAREAMGKVDTAAIVARILEGGR
jgi:hypothetical protein